MSYINEFMCSNIFRLMMSDDCSRRVKGEASLCVCFQLVCA